MIYDFPLNEKSRTYLRLESLFSQIRDNLESDQPWAHIAFFKGLFDLQELLERGDLRADLIKDLERLGQRLSHWASLPEVDLEQIQRMQQESAQLSRSLLNSPRPGARLKEDRLLGSIRQRFSIPGGLCAFDVPQLHHWLATPAVARHQQMQQWLSDINLLMNAISLLLRLWRESGHFSDQVATNGFFQDTAEGAELIRIRILGNHSCYPTLSGHKNRFALRFQPTTEQQIGDVPFQLACC
ncbi:MULTISPECIES: cell division protein ZapD [Aeromonas]|jgi:cell division protein ZapD|uniref:Cell division protein ZapD n=1 Tax=Aeromonas encheleia TaxID=73010 RepID=A0AAE9MGE1_9GAMM|nr:MULTISPECIES: cell division protein ZapD [Aeromonas]MBV7415450.1 cell division protein ZapD [Aeromonas sp. sif2433]MBV7598595.1 cell division protein ZapD [Aeromonas sp. sia0103]USV57226.1 cell division protein ZapD [Aeromonas encheleia]